MEMAYQKNATAKKIMPKFLFFFLAFGSTLFLVVILKRPHKICGLLSFDYLIVGCFEKLWYGGGDDKVHSKPSAPSQTLSVAFLPPLAQAIMLYKNKSCDKPKMNAPTEEIALNSAN